MALATRIFESIYIVFFILIIFSNYKKQNIRTIVEIFSITMFALILEYLSIQTFEAYHYSPDFIFQFGKEPDNVPIVIALAWGIIIAVSMKMSDISKIRRRGKPFLDIIYALTIDLSMDVIAIRIDAGLWDWEKELSNTISYDSFFGVRYGNFIGWYLIILIYSSILRYGRVKLKKTDKSAILYLSIMPIFAFIPFYLIFELIQQGKKVFNYAPYFMIVVVILLSLAFYRVYKESRINSKLSVDTTQLLQIELIAFYSFHVFFLSALFILDIIYSAPLIIFPSLFAILIHFVLHTTVLADKKRTGNINISHLLVKN